MIQLPNLKIGMGKPKTTRKETVTQKMECENCNTRDDLHIQRIKGHQRCIMLTELDDGVEVSKVKTKFADQLEK